jgi:hypothetical protein
MGEVTVVAAAGEVHEVGDEATRETRRMTAMIAWLCSCMASRLSILRMHVGADVEHNERGTGGDRGDFELNDRRGTHTITHMCRVLAEGGAELKHGRRHRHRRTARRR